MNPITRQLRVVIVSSWESRAIAEALQDCLQFVADITLFFQDFYPLSGDLADSLRSDLAARDFALFVHSVEDVEKMCAETETVTRDNILLGIGIALGVLGRRRTFFVYPRELKQNAVEFQIPVQPLGLIPVVFSRKFPEEDLSSTIDTACGPIKREFSRQGSRLPDPGFPTPSLPTPQTPQTVPVPISLPTPLPGKPETTRRPPIKIRFENTFASTRNGNGKGPTREREVALLREWWLGLPERKRRMIVRYAEVDQQLNLHEGVTKQHLREIADEGGYVADHETDSLIIFHPALPQPSDES